MSLKTHALALTGSDQTILTVPEGVEGTANNMLFTGSGDLTLKYKDAVTGTTHTVFSAKTVTDEIALERSFNLSSGDKLIASGDGLTAFISVYYVGADAGSAALPYGPGPQELKNGDMQSGYFGVVPAEAFYSGNRLALELGVTEGEMQNSDAGWLKFADNGVIKFIAKKSFLHSVTYDHLYSRGLVYGTGNTGSVPRSTPVNQFTTVEHGGNRFVVRLMTGAKSDPFPANDPLYQTDDMCQMNIGEGSEWNRLIYRVSSDEKSCSEAGLLSKHGGPQVGADWESHSKTELGLVGDGRETWCQETSSAADRFVVRRGFSTGVVVFDHINYNIPSIYRGWRPVLEMLPNK